MAKTPARKYPRDVWVLTPSFKPKQVTVVQSYTSWNGVDYGDVTATGKRYMVDDMHTTLEAAIAHGRARLVQAQARVDGMAEVIIKKRRQLDLAAAKK
jgi:hypothetical protein